MTFFLSNIARIVTTIRSTGKWLMCTLIGDNDNENRFQESFV